MAVVGINYWLIAILVILLGLFQGMRFGFAFITISNWFTKKESSFYNYMEWLYASYAFSAVISIAISILLLFLIKGKLENESLPPINKVNHSDMFTWEIMKKQVLNNKESLHISFINTFVYIIRFWLSHGYLFFWNN